MTMLFLGCTVAIFELSCMLTDAVSWDALKENVGFRVLVRVQAVVLLFTYLML